MCEEVFNLGFGPVSVCFFSVFWFIKTIYRISSMFIFVWFGLNTLGF